MYSSIWSTILFRAGFHLGATESLGPRHQSQSRWQLGGAWSGDLYVKCLGIVGGGVIKVRV